MKAPLTVDNVTTKSKIQNLRSKKKNIPMIVTARPVGLWQSLSLRLQGHKICLTPVRHAVGLTHLSTQRPQRRLKYKPAADRVKAKKGHLTQ
jgi:hypothetical protein